MGSLRRAAAIGAGAALLATLGLLAQPSPPAARANLTCDALGGGIEAITGGAIGAGNPVGDACNTVTDGVIGAATAPIKGALEGIGNGILNQITSWVADGASWLIGQVASVVEATTTPKLTTKGFLSSYAKMAAIGALLAAAMLLLAVLEGVAQGNSALLLRVVLVNLPLAFIATSVAYTLVQLLLVATDGLCHAIAAATQHDSHRFFAEAVKGLGHAGGATAETIDNPSGTDPVAGAAGHATGSVAVPLFVTFLAAIVGAFAAFFVWVELLMRDAAVYVVALFMPLALAASIWPRWSGALRRSAELLAVVVGSKFVIVAIISLAAGLLASNGGQIEHLLAASALMLLACFAPFVLFRLVPFAEGAMAAAYGRRSASGGAVSGMQLASEVQILRNMARSNWSRSSRGSGAGGSGGAPGPEPGRGGRGRDPAKPSAGSGVKGSEGAAAGEVAGAGAAAGAPAAAAAVPIGAARGAKGAAERLGQSGSASATGGATTGKQGTGAQADKASDDEQPRLRAVPDPEPAEEGRAPDGPGEDPPRPAPDISPRDTKGPDTEPEGSK